VEEQPAPHLERFATFDLLHKYGDDYKVIFFVGDAAMAPYDHPAGWQRRALERRSRVCGCSASWKSSRKSSGSTRTPRQAWDYTASTHLVRDLIEDKMYPLTLQGLEEGMRFRPSRPFSRPCLIAGKPAPTGFRALWEPACPR
jgi:uncharacterized protein with von Willebrand factor type A (vWA) domain